MKHELKISNPAFIPEAARPFFPSPIDGYLYLLDCGEAGFECRRYSYADSHPWKDYRDGDRLVEMMTRQAGENLIASVAAWNAAADAAQAKADADREALAERVQGWLNSLPAKVFGFRRESAVLMDECGNAMFNLDSSQFRFKSAYEIECEIEALFDEGFDPGA
jgi:hypothetical protein